MTRLIALSLLFAAAQMVSGQVRVSTGPLQCTPPAGYTIITSKKQDRIVFTSASPRLEVVLSHGRYKPESQDVWQDLGAIADARLKSRAVKDAADAPDPQRTRWLGLPALLYRVDEGQQKYKMVLTALDEPRGVLVQLEIGFAAADAKHVQKALEAWTKSVAYKP